MSRFPRARVWSLLKPAAAVILAALLIAGPAALLAPSYAQSTGRSVSALRDDVTLAVQPGGDVLVQETEQIAFQGAGFHNGSRQIPLDRVTSIQDVTVGEPGQPYQRASTPGAPLTYTVSGPTQGGRPNAGTLSIQWWFPETSNTTRTFVISYRAAGVVRYYPGGDQVRWDVIGSDHTYPIAKSTVTLRLPVDVPASGWSLAAYPPNDVVPGGQSASGSAATWEAQNIPGGQTFQVRAQWPHGLVSGSPPPWQAAADAADQRNENLRYVLDLAFGAGGVLVVVFGALGVLLLWYSRGRDPRIGTVPPQLNDLPSDLPPGLVGTVVDGHADAQDVIATVLDLAARGYVAISEVPDPDRPGVAADYELAQAKTETGGLRPYEQAVLQSFFSRGSPVRLSQLGDWFRVTIPFVERALHREAVQARLFTGNPAATMQRYHWAGAGLIGGGLLAGVIAWGLFSAYSAAVPWPFFGLALDGVLLYLMADRMPRRTPAGALEAARWRAYAHYLAVARPDAVTARVNAVTERNDAAYALPGSLPNGLPSGEQRQEVFERTLPYAVALGIERGWVEKFSKVGAAAPRWFQPQDSSGMPVPPVIIGGPMWGGPMWGGYGRGYGGPWIGGGQGGAPGQPNGQPNVPPGAPGTPGPGGLEGMSRGAAGGLQGASSGLAGLLNAVAEILGHGGGSGWSGGGFGGTGGGSGGGGGSFS